MRSTELIKFLTRLDGVERCGNNSEGRPEYKARCPAHDDRKASLSVSLNKDDKILINCHAGCSPEAIVRSLGIDMNALNPEPREKPKDCGWIEAEYIYQRDESGAPVFKKVKKRFSDGSKEFFWAHKEGSRWIWNQNGFNDPIPLYGRESLGDEKQLFIVEGEKDVDTLLRFGFPALTFPNGAGQTKYDKRYDEYFKGRDVYAIPDNDEAGSKYIEYLKKNVTPVADGFSVLDLSKVWKDMPAKADITDLANAEGDDAAVRMLLHLIDQAKTEPEKAEELIKADAFLSRFKTLDTITEEEPRWFINGYLPEGQITTFASDGGVGKTTMAVDTAANRSAGRPCLLDPPDFKCDPQLIAFLSTEDSVKKKLKRKLREAGANMKNILVPDFSDDPEGLLRDFKFGTGKMAEFIRYFKPALCIFDPLQGFIPPLVNMGSRNAMRDCMAPLISLGEETGTSFLILCHTNKRKAAYGRDRIADSADLWDISRSVLMMGYTSEQGIRYLSHEKSNYGTLQDTILFSIDETGKIQKTGTTWKRDREYQQEAAENISLPKRDDCKGWLLNALAKAGGSMPVSELEAQAKKEGYSASTIRRAKDELKQASEIKYFQTGSNEQRTWHIQRLALPEGWAPSDT